MDPLSDALSLMKLRTYKCGGLETGPEVSIAFPSLPGLKCYAVVKGRCWVAVEGLATPSRIEAGECFLLPTTRPFRIASDLALPSVDSEEIFASGANGAIKTYRGGGEGFVLASHFALEGEQADLLLASLPPLVHVRKTSDQAALRWALDRMILELREPAPGDALVAEHLAHLILIHALRSHLAEAPEGQTGWLFALADRRMQAALGAMHGDPARRWTLSQLAAHCGMSRSAFAARFRRRVGVAPLEHLARWRISLAADRLARSEERVSDIALSLGYESASAFSAAFRRFMSCSPRDYANRRTQRPDPQEGLPATIQA
ncbi:MAG: AraC family transcriptional regulator [Alphaproteobacteria bacterium]|nr:AraC family transcriptional regulator [Alphaproteobacteria bacterium]